MRSIPEATANGPQRFPFFRALWRNLVEDHSREWQRDYRIWLPLMLVSWWLAWKNQDLFISDWDGFDYTAYTVRGWPSPLGLGRTLFLGYNHLIWLIAHHWFGIPPEGAYLPLRYGVIAQSGPAIVGIYALGKELTANRLAAFFGGLLIALSPFYITYSGRVMSEIPALLLLGWSLWWMLKSLRLEARNRFLIASCLVGLSANIREFAVFYLPFIVLATQVYYPGRKGWKLGLGAFVLAAFGAVAGIIFWTIYNPDLFWPSMINWYKLSAQERRVHPVTSRNLTYLIDFAYTCSAAVTLLTPFALGWLWFRKNLRLLFWLGACGVVADLVLLANHDLAVNPRYLMTGLLGLGIVGGWCLAELVKAYRFRTAPLFIVLIVVTYNGYHQMRLELGWQRDAALAAKNYISRIESMPGNAAFIVGSRTPLINFYYTIGARPLWKTIASGSAWPDDKLDSVIDELLGDGRPVYVDFDPELWQQGMRTVSREGLGLEMIKRVYKLEQISGSFYRIVGKQQATNWSTPAKTS